jgi:hypothetical protein
MDVQELLIQKAAKEDLNFSQLARRALRQYVIGSGVKIKESR